MKYEKDPKRELAWVIVVVATVLIAASMMVATMGCKSCDCPECPVVDVPEVVDVPTPLDCPPILAPDDPVLILGEIDPEDTASVLEALASDYHELWRAWLECNGLIEAHNGGSDG